MCILHMYIYIYIYTYICVNSLPGGKHATDHESHGKPNADVVWSRC